MVIGGTLLVMTDVDLMAVRKGGLMSGTPSPKSGAFLLDCGCVKDFSQIFPQIGEEMTCRWHGKATVLSEANQWITKCEQCRTMVKHGSTGRLKAETSAVNHRKRKMYRAHVVTVFTPNGDVHRVFDGKGAGSTVPGLF